MRGGERLVGGVGWVLGEAGGGLGTEGGVVMGIGEGREGKGVRLDLEEGVLVGCGGHHG